MTATLPVLSVFFVIFVSLKNYDGTGEFWPLTESNGKLKKHE